MSPICSQMVERQRQRMGKICKQFIYLGKGYMEVPCPTNSYSFSVYLKLDQNKKF